MLSYLDGAPFVGSFEARYGSLGIYGKPRFLDVGRRIPARDRFAPDSPLEEHGFEPLVPQREGIGLFETTLIDLWPFTSAGSNLPPRGTWSLHPVCSSGESDQSRSGYTAVLKGGCPDAGLHPDQATRHILGHGVLLPVRESPPGSSRLGGEWWFARGALRRSWRFISRSLIAVISSTAGLECITILSIPLRPFHGLRIIPANPPALKETTFNLASWPY